MRLLCSETGELALISSDISHFKMVKIQQILKSFRTVPKSMQQNMIQYLISYYISHLNMLGIQKI